MNFFLFLFYNVYKEKMVTFETEDGPWNPNMIKLKVVVIFNENSWPILNLIDLFLTIMFKFKFPFILDQTKLWQVPYCESDRYI